MSDGSVDRPRPRRFGAVATALAVCSAFALSIPVVLLPLTTAVPPLAWVPMLATDLALIAWLIARRRRRSVRPLAVAGVTLLAVVAVVASQVLSATPAITSAQGHSLPGSIARLERVTLNGSEQWITLRGRDTANPVLLNLGMGGPGGGGFATRSLFEPLEEHFTVVSWDEPGTGKSYGAVPFEQLTRDRFVSDATALTNLLRQRFGQERIYLYGVSWSSILGIWLVQAHPELFHAFVSSGQMVNTTENDRLGYELALQHLDRQGNTAAADKLRRSGPPPYRGDNVVLRYVDYLDVLNEIMGEPRLSLLVPIVPFLAPEYGLVDKVNHTRGLIDSFHVVYPQLEHLDFVEQAPVLHVPVYFFVGRGDVNAMASLAQKYYVMLSAPHKELIWLDGGHGLDGSSQAQFVDVMVHRVKLA
jgi:pimeloyl-ACP methyl ester carboxylesterase